MRYLPGSDRTVRIAEPSVASIELEASETTPPDSAAIPIRIHPVPICFCGSFKDTQMIRRRHNELQG
jgi:hypothetical protein